jgi:hypothetical protein
MSSFPSASGVAELSRGRDWTRLWRFALDLPLAEAVAAVAQIGRRWRPADDPGRDLLSRLAAARPGQIRAATAPPAPVELSLRRLRPRFDCEFAPGGGAVAVHHNSSEGLAPPVIYCELPGGRRKQGFHAFGTTVALFDGGMVYAAQGKSYPVTPWFRYLPGHGSDALGQVRPQSVGNRAAAVKGGFVIAEPDRLLYGTAEPGSPLRDVTPPALQLDGDRDVFHDVVADPLTGRLAVHIVRRSAVLRDDVLILGPDFSVGWQLTIPFDERWRAVSALGFCRPDRFITLHGADRGKQLRSWAVGQPAVAEGVAEGVAEAVAEAVTQAEAQAEIELSESYHVQPLPYTGLIRHDRRYLDATTLRPAACPRAFGWEPRSGGHVTVSRDEGYAAISQSWEDPRDGKRRYRLLVRDQVQQELSEWAARPMASFSVDDVAAVTALCERARRRPAEHAAVLLRDCLQHRIALNTELR